MMKPLPIVVVALMSLTTPAAAAPAYPPTVRGADVEARHGISAPDPYRWLEADVRKEPRVADWVAAQNQVTDAYLASLPKREAIRARLTQLFDYERIRLPVARAGKLFFRRNSGLQNQDVLYVEEAGVGAASRRQLIDPNVWSKDGATALAEWAPSDDGRFIAYAVQDGGTDWRTVRVLDVAAGRVLDDKLDWVKFSPLAYGKDGFFYARYPEQAGGPDFQSEVQNHAIWFHKVGTPQSADVKVFATPDHPGWYHDAEVSADGRWLIIRSSTGSDDSYEVRARDLGRPDSPLITLVAERTDDWRFAGNRGEELFFVTNRDAPRYRVVALDAIARRAPRVVVAEGGDTLTGASLVGDQLLVTALKDARTEVRRYAADGTPAGTVPLPGLGTASGFEASHDGSTTYFTFTSYNAPTTIYRYDAAANAVSVWAAPKVAFDPADYVVEQRFFTSKDGTRVPMFVAHKKGLKLPAPTLMYGYGGFNINVLPAFQVDALAWMEMGGVYAEVTLRGGGEYGAAWHDAGRRFKKQNVFDDFIGAGEALIAAGITRKGGLAIQGGSNGGLLVGAVVNQRPDLFAAALPAVGVMDMLRFPLFTEGRTWTDDYGDPADPAAFKNLLAYSPYHNIVAGKDYPAILVTTADTDDRVVPGHSFKYVSALQAAAIGDRPHLIRIETRAGHGSGKPTTKVIAEAADLWAFAGYWTGLTTAP
ncbi:prolyl endopeptidase [alpha proteobacterium AAP81b]|nr:prolyl endopeptidase [alpha proteobacterium AAP81b]